MLPYWMPMPNIISDSEVKELERLVIDGRYNFIPYPTKHGNYDGNLCWDNNIKWIENDFETYL